MLVLLLVITAVTVFAILVLASMYHARVKRLSRGKQIPFTRFDAEITEDIQPLMQAGKTAEKAVEATVTNLGVAAEAVVETATSAVSAVGKTVEEVVEKVGDVRSDTEDDGEEAADSVQVGIVEVQGLYARDMRF